MSTFQTEIWKVSHLEMPIEKSELVLENWKLGSWFKYIYNRCTYVVLKWKNKSALNMAMRYEIMLNFSEWGWGRESFLMDFEL